MSLVTTRVFMFLVAAFIACVFAPRFAEENTQEKPEEKTEEKKSDESKPEDKSSEPPEGSESADLEAFGLNTEDEEHSEEAEKKEEKPEHGTDDVANEEKPETSVEADKTTATQEPDTAKSEEPTKKETQSDQEPKKVSAKEYFSAVARIAKKEVEKEFGEEYDEFNDDHKVALQTISQDIISADRNRKREKAEDDRRQAEADKKMKEAVEKTDKILPSKEYKEFAAAKFENLSYKDAKKLLDAQTKGDHESILGFFEKCKKEFEDNSNARKRGQEKIRTLKPKAGNPPVVEGSGAGESGHETETAGLEDFGLSGRT